MKLFYAFLLILLCGLVGEAQEQGKISVRSETDSVIVYVDSNYFGRTPLESFFLDTGKHILRFIHPGARDWYMAPVIETVMVRPGLVIERSVTFSGNHYSPEMLTSSWKQGIDAAPGMDVPVLALEGKELPSATPLYLTTAGAVVSGTVAVYFKIKADNQYEEYQRTGDTQLLDKVKVNDTVSGIALGVCELNLIALTYFLLSR